MSRAHHKQTGRPDRWPSGRCERGHDVTLPGAVRIEGTARICVECRREKQREWARNRAATQRPTGPTFDRCVVCGGPKKARARRAVKTCGPKCLAELNRTSGRRAQLKRERQPTQAEIIKILDLRSRAEIAPVLEKARLIALAESIRLHGLPSEKGTERQDAYNARRRRYEIAKARAKLLGASGAAGGDGGPDAGDRDPAPAGDRRDGGAVGVVDEAAAQRAEGGRADSDGSGGILERNAGSGVVDQAFEGLMHAGAG